MRCDVAIGHTLDIETAAILALPDDMTRTALFMLYHGRTLSFEQQTEPTLRAMTDQSQGSLQNPGPAGNHGRLILPHGGSDTRTQGDRQVCIQCVDVHQASACARVGDQHSETWARNTGMVRTRAALRPVGGDKVADHLATRLSQVCAVSLKGNENQLDV